MATVICTSHTLCDKHQNQNTLSNVSWLFSGTLFVFLVFGLLLVIFVIV